MGLDITAVSNISLVERHIEPGEWCENEDHIEAFAYASFPHSYRGLADADREFAVGRGSKFIGGRCYDTSKSEVYDFRAGSYSGYGTFRRKLAQMVGLDLEAVWETPCLYIEHPFFELVNFADNEGCIGAQAAGDLLADFRKFENQYRALVADDTSREWWSEKYDDWMKALTLASNNGLVAFH